MKREEIEERAHKFDPWLYANYRESLVEFVIQIHDAALEEAAEYGDLWKDSNCRHHDDDPCCHARSYANYSQKIRTLKVTP